MVQNVCLVGGFGASPYLQERLEKSLKLRNDMKMRRPAQAQAYVNLSDIEICLTTRSMTAVVQGAVVYGIEKSRHKEAKYISEITKSYGIVLDGRFEWLIRKGDLVLSNEKRSIQSKYFWIPSKVSPLRKYDFPIYVYKGKEEDDVPTFWQNGKL